MKGEFSSLFLSSKDIKQVAMAVKNKGATALDVCCKETKWSIAFCDNLKYRQKMIKLDSLMRFEYFTW